MQLSLTNGGDGRGRELVRHCELMDMMKKELGFCLMLTLVPGYFGPKFTPIPGGCAISLQGTRCRDDFDLTI